MLGFPVPSWLFIKCEKKESFAKGKAAHSNYDKRGNSDNNENTKIRIKLQMTVKRL